MSIRDLAIVMVVVVAAAWIGVEAWNAYDDASAPDYEYLECVPLEDFGDVTAVTGCAEIVNIGGTDYMKMTDVGKFTVFHGSTATSYRVGPAKLDLFLLTGQSNSMIYTAPGYWPDGDTVLPEHGAEASPLEPGTAFYLGTPEGKDDTPQNRRFGGVATAETLDESGIQDMTAPDGDIRLAQTYPVFMYDWMTMTGHRLLVINSGIGGKSITEFAEGGECYDWTMDVVGRAVEVLDSAHYRYEAVGVLWSQGEADATRDVADYASRLKALIGEFADGTFGISFPHVWTSIPAHPTVSSPTNADLAQRQIAEEDDRFSIATELPPLLPDGTPYYTDVWHYTQRVYNWIGEAFARSAASLSGFDPVPETLVYAPEVAEDSPDATVYGTSGAAYEAAIVWDGGTAAIAKMPPGTVADHDLTINSTEGE